MKKFTGVFIILGCLAGLQPVSADDAKDANKIAVKTIKADTINAKIINVDTLNVKSKKSAADMNMGSVAEIGDNMVEAERYVEEYGSINISLPVLAKLNTKDFNNFDLTRGATNYYSDAKNQVQTTAASFQQVIQSLSVSAQADLDPTVVAGYTAQLGNYFSSLQRFQTKQNLLDLAAQQQYQAQLSDATNATQRAQALATYVQQYTGGSNAPAYPTDNQSDTNLPAPGLTVAGRPNVTNVLSSQQFLPFQGLLNTLNNAPQPTLSDRSAIITAAGDTATESIFRHFMGSTNLVSDSAEDNLYFGFSTVSVDPGWRTRKGWIAEDFMTAEIYYTTSRLDVVRRVFERCTNNNDILIKLYNQYGGNVIKTVAAAKSLDKAITAEANKAQRVKKTTEKFDTYDAIKNNPGDGKTEEQLVFAFLKDDADMVPESYLDKARVALQSYKAKPDAGNIKALGDAAKDIVENLTTNLSYVAPPFWLLTNADALDPVIPVPVTVISPLIDADAEDFSESTRSQTEFALALSFALRYAGFGGQAHAFEQFVKSKQFDQHTRSQSVAINGYAGADGRFGFQIGPRLKAPGNPAKESSGTDLILERQSFPVLLILALDGVDLSPRLWQYDPGHIDRLMVIEPQIRFTEVRRWTPIKHSFTRDGFWNTGWPYVLFQPTAWQNQALTERKRLLMLYQLQQARNLLTSSPEQFSGTVTRALKKRIDYLEAQMAGGEGSLFLAASDIVPPLPVGPASNNKAPAAPLITATIPAQVPVDATAVASTQQIVFLGTGLDQVRIDSAKTNVTFLPETLSVLFNTNNNVLERIGQSLILTLTMNNTANPAGAMGVFKLATTNGAFVLSLPVTFGSKPPPALNDKIQSVSFSTTGTNGAGGFTYSVTAPTNFSSADVVGLTHDLVKSDLEKNKPDQSAATNSIINISVKPGAMGTNGVNPVIHL